MRLETAEGEAPAPRGVNCGHKGKEVPAQTRTFMMVVTEVVGWESCQKVGIFWPEFLWRTEFFRPTKFRQIPALENHSYRINAPMSI
jgi:hypothetical protein